ncbi:GIY-YIG nuclease family protein [Amnibacterium flavum]|uniref:GIY-YIG domain-containing protein n=1 Tax=Amnibacterium flavum TaxID=2173173 RepID=A0A2V1HY71_9MICO|nr:GIY-YIG nuclease family protein [Amnibacterium flavum]PVZ95697.1 hypothetical protein DDQ50_04235 [Amnibacterium flavum]
MGWVYILECSDATLYVGSTSALAQRFEQHQRGEGAAYTRRRLPVRLIWCARFDRISEAFAFEKKVQGWSRAKKLALIEGRYDSGLWARGVKPSRMHIRTDHLPTITPW